MTKTNIRDVLKNLENRVVFKKDLLSQGCEELEDGIRMMGRHPDYIAVYIQVYEHLEMEDKCYRLESLYRRVK